MASCTCRCSASCTCRRVLLFDLGVYMLVVGATVLMLVAIAHQSLRRPRKTAAPIAELELRRPSRQSWRPD